MIRSTAGVAALLAATVATAQTPDILRTDAVPNTVQLTLGAQTVSSTSPNVAKGVLPSQTQPNYNFGYALTGPTTGLRRPIFLNDVYNRVNFSASNLLMSFTGSANGHTFQRAVAGALSGPVRFQATYRSNSIISRDITFTAPPTAQISGPTANLTATLNNTRIGALRLPRYQVNGFFVNAAGVNTVNQLTGDRAGGITFNTRLAAAPAAFNVPLTQLTVPPARLTVQPRVPTIAEFRAYYELRVQ